jgi:hypothetical protein
LDLNQSQASSDDENHNIYKRISGFQQGQHFPTKPLLTDGWTLRIAEDGMTEFYHNPLTGGLRWTHPSQEESDEEDYEGDYDSDNLIHHYRRSDSDNDDSTTHESFEDYHDFGTVRSRELSRQSSFDEREKSETNNVIIMKHVMPNLHPLVTNIVLCTYIDYVILDKKVNPSRKNILCKLNNSRNYLGHVGNR